MADETEPNSGSETRSRRSVLRSIGGLGVTMVGSASAYRHDRTYEDHSDDGIPVELKRSEAFHDRLADLFGSESFEGLKPGRMDFLVDARYVGDATVDDAVKRYLEELFRDNGIYMQWVDHPDRMDERQFLAEYGNDAHSILWSKRGFYAREVESYLKDIALQLVVVPGRREPPYEGRIYSELDDIVGLNNGWLNGVNTGNRAVMGHRESRREQARLSLHEIAHLVLCHDDDPTNSGVMGVQEEVDLTPAEWSQFRDGLDGVRDTTGYDIALRRCSWEEYTPSRPTCCE